MKKNRLEGFSDGIIAIIITIMVLELRIPHEATIASLYPVLPAFLSYVLSFIYLAIYWNNHHHMLKATLRINGGIMWANIHLLFWLSLIPFTTGWMGENHFAATPTALYGLVLLMAALAYSILQFTIMIEQGKESVLAQAIGRDFKGKASLALYAAAIGCALLAPWVAQLIYVIVALIWLVPDRRIENIIKA